MCHPDDWEKALTILVQDVALQVLQRRLALPVTVTIYGAGEPDRIVMQICFPTLLQPERGPLSPDLNGKCTADLPLYVLIEGGDGNQIARNLDFQRHM